MDVVGDTIKSKARRVLFCSCGVNITCFIRLSAVSNELASRQFDKTMS